MNKEVENTNNIVTVEDQPDQDESNKNAESNKNSKGLLEVYNSYNYIKEPDFFNLLTELILGHWLLKAEIRICCHIKDLANCPSLK